MLVTSIMRRAVLLSATAYAFAFAFSVAEEANAAGSKRVCVSWRHFQEERWRIDEAGIKSVLEPAGYTYVSADAQPDPQKQLTGVESLLSSTCDAAIILAQDSKAIMPAVAGAKAAGVPVIAYDVPIDSTDVTFISFDNVAVGRLMAEAMVKVIDHGNWVKIDGDAAMTIINLFGAGQMQVIQPLIDSGKIKIVAQQKMLGIPLSGQDGDKVVLNRIAKKQQTVTIWKNSYLLGRAAAKAAIEMAEGKPVTDSKPFKTETGQEQPSLLLDPIAITYDTLDKVVDAKWISKEELCAGVTENPPAPCK